MVGRLEAVEEVPIGIIIDCLERDVSSVCSREGDVSAARKSDCTVRMVTGGREVA